MKAFLLVLVAATVLAGCGSPKAEFVTPDQDEQGRYVIEMTSANTYVPARAVVPVGATVLWKHVGGSHNVVSDKGVWAESEIGSDFELTVTASMVGDHAYHCRPHQSLGMTGVLRVTA